MTLVSTYTQRKVLDRALSHIATRFTKDAEHSAEIRKEAERMVHGWTHVAQLCATESPAQGLAERAVRVARLRCRTLAQIDLVMQSAVKDAQRTLSRMRSDVTAPV